MVEISLLLLPEVSNKGILTDKVLEVCIDVVLINLGIVKDFLWLKTCNFKVREQDFWGHPGHWFVVG